MAPTLAQRTRGLSTLPVCAGGAGSGALVAAVRDWVRGSQSLPSMGNSEFFRVETQLLPSRLVLVLC